MYSEYTAPNRRREQEKTALNNKGGASASASVTKCHGRGSKVTPAMPTPFGTSLPKYTRGRQWGGRMKGRGRHFEGEVKREEGSQDEREEREEG